MRNCKRGKEEKNGGREEKSALHRIVPVSLGYPNCSLASLQVFKAQRANAD